MISLVSLATTTKGIDICNAVVKALIERVIDLSKMVSVTTDGARNMTGEENGFIILFIGRLYSSKFYEIGDILL